MDDRTLYATIRGVMQPWEVTRVELDDGVKTVSVWLTEQSGTTFTCPACQTVSPLHDHTPGRRKGIFEGSRPSNVSIDFVERANQTRAGGGEESVGGSRLRVEGGRAASGGDQISGGGNRLSEDDRRLSNGGSRFSNGGNRLSDDGSRARADHRRLRVGATDLRRGTDGIANEYGRFSDE
jgi:hypothetical protein